MPTVGLTGGIGCGKSAVADLLVERGAVLIDADLVARQVVEPGGPAYRPLVERFGEGILTPDGTIDRPALATVAFADPKALGDLNAITHPAIGVAMAEARRAQVGRRAVVVLAVPLLKALHRTSLGLDAVVVVDCPPEVAVERLVGDRGMDRADAEARMAAQDSREQRLEGADFVVDNGSDRAHLAREVDRLWAWLATLPAEVGPLPEAAGPAGGPEGV
jgi:dephospho-CoA kinase